MSNDTANRTGRTNGASPMGSTVAIVITVVAVILGIFILRKVNDEGGSTSANTNTTNAAVTTLDPTATTEPPVIENTTTTIGLIVEGTQLQVANASNQDGVAGQMSAVLATKGFTMAEAVSASEKLEFSKVLYNASDPAAKAVAESLAAFFGGIEVAAQGLPVPVASGNWAEGSGVVLMLGNDFAGKTLDQIAGIPTTGTTAPAVTTTTTV
jgi:hypothetical protein